MPLRKIEDSDIGPDMRKPAGNQTAIIASIIIGCSVIAASVLVSAIYVGGRWKQASEARPASVVSGPGADLAGQQKTEPARVNIEVPDSLPYVGNKDSKVTVVEFADFQCPFCKRWHETVWPRLKSQYIDTGKIKFVYHDFAFLGEESQLASEAGKCAAEQGKFWEMYDTLYKNQGEENSGAFSLANLQKLGAQVVPDRPAFNTCMASRKHQTAVEDETLTGEGYGISATPTVVINGERLEGVAPFAQYARVIEEHLAK